MLEARPWAIAWCLALAACNRVFDISTTEVLPDADLDRDNDGINDDADNCIDLVNASQLDVDGDGVGDECDNCPLTENTLQPDEGDGDAIGDDCDPHPLQKDCLVLLDRFRDESAFATNWEALAVASDTPEITFRADGIELKPHALNPVAILARVGGARLTGELSVQLLGTHLDSIAGSFALVIANAAGLDDYIGCGLSNPGESSIVLRSVINAATADALTTPLPTNIIRTDLDLRLVRKEVSTLCLAVHGIAVASTAGKLSPVPGPGGVGVYAKIQNLHVSAIAVYETATSCKPSVVR